MADNKIKKVVLAYSGGLDTSIIIPWLKENYDNCEVIAVSGDVGQGTELDGLEEKAIKTGASKLYIEDLNKEFVDEYIIPTVKAGAVYEGKYLLGTSFARPIIAKRLVEIAKAEGADLVIATDPDCDRVGVAVKTTTGDYALLTGNQIGAMLTNYIIESSKEENKLDPKATLVKTIVTSEFGADIARANNLDVINVLTGFKFIGQKIKSFEESGDRTYLFGYEESYGYLVGTHARDKDGVVASLLISEMAAYYYDKGMSLYEGLQELYKKYGYFKEKTISLTLKGIEGLAKIKEIITYFRENDIKEFNNTKVVDLKDYQKGIDDLPKSNVLKYFLEDGSWIAVRPSGTEPKLKFYVAVKGQDESECAGKIANIESDINKIIDQVK